MDSGENGIVELSGFTIQNSYNSANGGGIHVYNSSPNFKDLIIQNNAAFNMGGGIYINGGSQTITNCKIYNNQIDLSELVIGYLEANNKSYFWEYKPDTLTDEESQV